MSNPNTFTEDAADRLAIRELIDAYAHRADRREAEDQAALFTDDARVAVYPGDPDMVEPSQVLHGRAEILAGFIGLSAYDATTHFNGQHTVVIAGDNATAETYCLAHHLFADDDGVRTLLVMSVRYLDVFVREADGWLINDRQIVIDWTDRRPSMA